MDKLRNIIRKILDEEMKIDLEKGDVILTGKFKNKRRIVKTIGTDDLGQPTINGKPALKFRIEKEMPKKRWSKKSKEELEEEKLQEGLLLEEENRVPFDIQTPEDLRNILWRINNGGRKLYLVGGAVRDALQGKVPHDYDLATDAEPERVIKILGRDNTLRIDLTGKSFGVVRVKTTDGNEYEIATFRKDVGGGRRPDSVEWTDMEEDANRRDLTINALYYDLETKEIIDFVGGIEDIENGIIRSVGDPAQRFMEDRLRILRVARFAARLGSDVDDETQTAILQDNELIDVPPERIKEEILKGIEQAIDVQHFFSLLESFGLYSQIFPSLIVDVTDIDERERNPAVILAQVLIKNNPEDVKTVLKTMAFKNAIANQVGFLLKFSEITPDIAPELKKTYIKQKITPDDIIPFADDKIIQAFISFVNTSPTITPKELMAQGLRGPAIGKALYDDEVEIYSQLIAESAKLRFYIRKLIRESRYKQMSKSIYTDLKSHLQKGSFMNVDAGGDYDGEYDQLSSEAQQQLIIDLNEYFDANFGVGEISLSVRVDHMLTLPTEGYNKVLKGGSYYFDGLHNIDLILAQMDDGETLSQLGNVSRKIYEVVLHELLHMQQFMKFSRGEPTIEKWNEFKKKYEEAGGASGMGNDYFFFDQEASELETFSIQIATELVGNLGKESAVNTLRQQHPDYDFIKDNSASLQNMIDRGVDVNRPEMREMIKRAKEYAKRMR